MTSPRLQPAFWRHDGYTLRRLADAVTAAAATVLPAPARPSARVVDLGAGDAPYRALFERRGAQYLACDLDAADPALRIVPGQPLGLAAGVAQAVVSFQVLEHVWDLDAYLGEARRLLADDGHLVLSTHGVWPYHPHPTDYRRWTRDGLLQELRQRGFEPVQVQALLGPLAWTTQVRALGWCHVLGRVPLLGGLLSALAGGLFHLRMRLEDAITPADWIAHNAAIYLVVARKAPLPPAHP